jgi:uncharacterized membrane protein YhhN
VLNTLIMGLAAMLLAGLLSYEGKENQKGLLISKTALSSLFIVALLVQPHPVSGYTHLLLAGLLLCLAGDILLALPMRHMFFSGLVAFLFAHILYILAFFSVASVGPWTWIGLPIVLVISGWTYVWLRPHLGSMKTAVSVYIIVISGMVIGASSVLGSPSLAHSGRMMVFAGAFSFYFSDVFVARDRFLKREFLNRLVGLPMYYTGQFLLAFSVGLLR